MPSTHAQRLANKARAASIPIFREGYIPEEFKSHAEDDTSGFRDVMTLLLRSWPYVRPQLLGYWWKPGEGTEREVADNVAGSGYHYAYAPWLALVVAVASPLLGISPTPIYAWPNILLYIPVAVVTVCLFAMAYSKEGPLQSLATLGVIIAGIGANTAGLLVDGWADSVYAGLVTLACIFGWVLQYRYSGERVEYRVRTRTHLVYFYAINFAQRFIALFLGLVLVDLLNQNILQGEPLAPLAAEILRIPEWTQQHISELTTEQRHELKWIYAYIAFGAYLIQFPLNIFNPYYNLWIMQRINQDLRLALVARWHQLSMSYHSEHRTGDSIFRIYQDSAMVTAVIGHLINLTLSVMSYFSSVFLVSVISPLLGALAGFVVVPALLWAKYAMPRVRVRSLAYRAATSNVTSTVQETFSSVRLIKAFTSKDRAQQRLERDSVVAFNTAYRIRNLIAVVTIVMFTIAALFMISGEFTAALWAKDARPTWWVELIMLVGVSFVVWNLSAFQWTIGEYRGAANNLRGLLRNWMSAQDMAMGLRRVFDILDIEPDVKDRDEAVPFTSFNEEIRFEHVRFSYEPNRPVLDDVSFSASPGSITAIIGPTGSGKSTLTTLLLRLFDPEWGAISIDGRDLRDYQVGSLRRNIAIALQENVLFAMSVRDNIKYVAPGATDEQLEAAVHVAAMDEYVAGLPRGLDTVLSDRGGRLSSGQKQRLSIARAVVRDTPILVLDEPTAALDAATEHEVMENLSTWGEGRAIFIITHRISTIRRADNILYLDGGQIVESGSHEELMLLEGGRYRAFVEAESHLTDVARELPRRD